MPIVQCKECQGAFEKKGYAIKASPNHFCSRSCAAKYNNRSHPKRSPEGTCKRCGKKIRSSRSYCAECLKLRQFRYNKISDIQKRARYQINAQIRGMARNAFKRSGRPLICAVCGYTKKVDVCHLKGISEFSPDAFLKEVNAPSNLAPMCPNHHWEWDHGLMIEAERQKVLGSLPETSPN